MSSFASEYSMTSVNSINENIYNARKQAKTSKYRLRKIFKPILKMLLQKGKKTNKHCNCNKNSSFESYDYASENDANETLETRILDEIRDCSNNSAIYVYGDEEQLVPVDRNQTFVPVHFARTNVGTFFWTTFDDKSERFSDDQLPQLHHNRHDRWIQA